MNPHGRPAGDTHHMSTIPKFNDSVESHHERLAIDDTSEVYVVGDVHGSRAALESLLDTLSLGTDGVVVFVGDLVRKGPDSPGVIDLVRTDDRLVSVRGNNEQKIVRGDKSPSWLRDGDKAYFESLPVVVSFDDAMVVHGGIDPRRSLTAHGIEELLTMRSPYGDGYDGPFWYETYDGPHRVFFGHTVHDTAVVRDHAVGLDTGCVYGGTLTAYDYHRDELITIDQTTCHEARADAKIVTVS